ncbi:MAG: response regulator transcription factor [Actinomycetia bacterium]|nr:response regulator transcription factor [Actinomycetes bacterium]
MSALADQRGTAYAVRSPRFTALVAVADAALRHDVLATLHSLGATDVAEAASIAEARARTRLGPPRDLLVVELGLPDGSGVALLGELRAAGWHRCVLLAADGDPFSVRAALAAGVRGFVVDGHRQAGRRGGERPPARGLTSGIESLSAREIEVLELVASGRSNRDIGAVLHLSALTVKSHLARIARKLGTGDRAEMVALALRAGVIS